MGILLSLLLFLAFFYEQPNPNDLGKLPPVQHQDVATPVLDEQIMAMIEDDNRLERLRIKPEVLSHLLEKSSQVVPAVADALGMPSEAIPIEQLQAQPESFRGRYLGYTGVLRYLSPGREGHPFSGWQIREGWIDTESGERLLFFVSDHDSEEIKLPKEGDFVRVEGFFMKLRDMNLPEEVNKAPVLVGPEIFPDYEPWEPTYELDPTILAEIHDGAFINGRWEDLQDMERYVLESQGMPLWHLTNYVLSQEDRISALDWRKIPPLVSKEDFDSYRRSTPASRNELRGEPHRILGSFIQARTHAAKPNPLGIEAWTEAWVQVRDIGGQTLPVWIPKRIGNIKRNIAINCRAFFYRLMAYKTLKGEMMYVPLFVASDLHPLEPLPEHPVMQTVKFILVAAVALIALIFFQMNRRMKKQRLVHEEEMVVRRRRRRKHAEQPSASGVEA